MIVRRERPEDLPSVRAVHRAAFAVSPVTGGPVDGEPGEIALLEALRADTGWIPALSLVAVEGGDHAGHGGRIVGHVCATRGTLTGSDGTDAGPAVGIGPLGVLPDRQRRGVGTALLHALIAVAEASGERVALLLGDTGYYARLGFVPASSLGITPEHPDWGAHFQGRVLDVSVEAPGGGFRYAQPFREEG